MIESGGRRLRRGVMLLALFLASPAVAGEWVLDDARGVPGETVLVPVHFLSDGKTIAAQTTMYFGTFLGAPPPGPVASDGIGMCVSSGLRVDIQFGSDSAPAGTLLHICSIPVRVLPSHRRNEALQTSAGTCMDSLLQASPCVAGRASFFIDGPTWPYQRAATVIPRAQPRGPSPQELIAFDYADGSRTPPLASLDAPRPEHVHSVFAQHAWSVPSGKAFEPQLGTPNNAVASLLRGVRATYATEADHRVAVPRLQSDPGVEAVIPLAGLTPFLVYPERPLAGRPFAVWFATGVCGNFSPATYDDRIVIVTDNVVQLMVPQRGGNLCGVPPPGELHYLINMPALDAGTYVLQLSGYYDIPGDLGGDHHSLVFTVNGVATAVGEPRAIPASGLPMLILLVSGVWALARRKVRSHLNRQAATACLD